MNVGIVGASGYSGEVLVGLLSQHPSVDLVTVGSRAHAGKPVAQMIPAVAHQVGALRFSASDPAELAARQEVAVWFLALPHGVASTYARHLLDAGRVVIDLSADFRLNSAECYREYYGEDHPEPELLREAAYVIPELHPLEGWSDARLIACPGCYPTSVQMPMAPLLRAGLIAPTGAVISSMSGVSGAGKRAESLYSYCERAESLTAYGQPKHRHLSEIEEQLSLHAGAPVIVQFNPHLVPMRRGILTTIVVPGADGATIGDVYSAWSDAFAPCPWVRLLPTGTFPDTAHVTGANRVDLAAVHDPRTGNFVLSSALDNLMKGASGQAVQIFNLRFGYPETAGL